MPGRLATACCAGGALLAGAAFLTGHSPWASGLHQAGASGPDSARTASRERPDELKAEIADLTRHLAVLDKDDLLERAVYQGLLDQARKNLREHPLAMTWEDFYRTSEAARVDERTLIRNILERLAPEAGLSSAQRRDVLSILNEERARTEDAFRGHYARLIEADTLGNLPDEEVARVGEEIARLRAAMRALFEPRYAALLTTDQLRLVKRHLRNDRTCGYTTTGQLLGGVGIPAEDFGASEQAH